MNSFVSFNQAPPALGNQFIEDRVLRSYLKRLLPEEVRREIEPALASMGELAGGELYQLQLEDRLNEPVLTQWNAWGERIDRIAVTPLWQRAMQIAAEHGVVASAYEKKYGRFSRPYQFALAYLFHPSTDVYTCPLAMTDGAARTLLYANNHELIQRALPHLISRDPAQFWTSGQWMTETTGGSDVGASETLARCDERGQWRLFGRKWFTSATTSQMAITLARPDGNPPGGKGLALFYVETYDSSGRLCNISVNRLKDKLGTRKVPTAELMLEGTPAQLIMGATGGVKNIVPMLHLTRTWNSVTAAAFMRRGLALARDYARKRQAFGEPLARQPLHVDTLAGLQSEMEAAFHLSFYLTELIGLDESGEASPEQQALLRLLTSLTKLTTGRQAVTVMTEIIESFGGAGYVEDTGLPMLVRDALVLPIWEGTTNVLSLDALKAVASGSAWAAFQEKIGACLSAAREALLVQLGAAVRSGLAHADAWLNAAKHPDQPEEKLESGARRFALSAGRLLELALLIQHAQWSLDFEQDGRPRQAAARFAMTGIDLLADSALSDWTSLVDDQ